MRKHLMFPHLFSLLTSRWLTIFSLTWLLSHVEGLMAPYHNLRNILSREFPPSRSAAGAGVTFWVPTHAPQVSATHPGSVFTFLSHHAPGSSLGMTLSWVVTILGITLRWHGLHESGYSPLVLELWPWSHLSLPSNLASGNFVPSTVFPTRGYRGATPSAPYPGDALLLAAPHLGDASSSWRRLILLPRAPQRVPSYLWLWL